MSFDRSKYLGGSRKAQAKKAEVAEKFERKSGGGVGVWHYIEDGKNTLRIAPPHNPEHSAYEVYRTTTLECMKPIYKDGEITDEKELGRKKIVSALVHNDQLAALGVTGDPVELYVKLVKDIAFKTIQDKDERKKFLAHVNGFRGKDKKWVWGIEPRTSYLAYAWDKDKALGKVELNKGWMGDIDRLSEELEEDGVPIEIDPFSNPMEGYPLLITKGKNDSGKTEYIIDKEMPSRLKKETYDDFFERTAITDEQLEELDGKKPLNDSYTNSYKLSDFEFQMDGLQRFDDKHGYGILDLAEFQDAIAVIMDILVAEDEASTAQAETTEDGAVDKVEEAIAEGVPAKKAPAKKAPVKKAVAKKAPVKKVDTRPKTIAEYIAAIYGEEYVNQVPLVEDGIVEWFSIVEASEADGDLPLVATEDFVASEAEVESPVNDPDAEVEDALDDEATAKMREQMDALRKGRR